MKKRFRLKQAQTYYPMAVTEITKHLRVQAIFSLVFGFFSIAISLYLVDAIFFFLGLVFVLAGLFIILISIEFSRLRPWTYGVAKFLVSPWLVRDFLSFAINRDLSKKISSPTVQHAFGIESESKKS